VFPEAGAWATTLRPPRLGASLLALRTGAPLLPIGLDGLINVFPSLRKGKRAKVTIRVGAVLAHLQAKRADGQIEKSWMKLVIR